jgi:hypothetical protein
MSKSARTESVKEFIRHPYAWPGGYPLFAITHDGAALCKDCTKKEAKTIIKSTRDGANDGWNVEGVDVNWEDPQLYCDHCSKRIESAYAEDDAESAA